MLVFCTLEPLGASKPGLEDPPRENALDLEATSNTADEYMTQTRQLIRASFVREKTEAGKTISVFTLSFPSFYVSSLGRGQNGRDCMYPTSAWKSRKNDLASSLLFSSCRNPSIKECALGSTLSSKCTDGGKIKHRWDS